MRFPISTQTTTDGNNITSTTILLTLLAVMCASLLLNKTLSVSSSAAEPPYIAPKVPYIGHAIGLLQKKYRYYVDLSFKHGLPIYGLAIPGMPGGRVYVINSPDLVLAVQRQPKKFSFWFIEAKFSVGMGGLSQVAADAIQKNVHGEGNKRSLFMDGMMVTHKTLKPGEALNELTALATQKIAASMNKFENDIGARVDLWSWVNHNLALAITDSVYGPKNPYKDPEVRQAFLDFEDNAVGLLSYPFPSVTCTKAYVGREKVVAAFERYYEARGLDKASQYVRARVPASEGYGLSVNDMSRLETTNGHALLANTVPTAFWTLYHVFSDPLVLEEVREQLMPLLIIENDNNKVSRTINIGAIRDVSILNSVLHESLRHYASGTGSRIVLEDTMLDDRYLLKKDAFIFMPNRSYHFDASAWGPTVQDFDAHRFVRAKSHHAGAFRGFGGGANLCPGRLFAMNEILSMCAMFALRYDMTPTTGQWVHPGADDSNLSLIVLPPKQCPSVEIKVRKGWEGGSWAFKM